uniref:Myelin expression factor 2 n=1 Tax=Gadus morhua TaxID=8049 RepID=A0A8C4Z7W3_GADMO
MEDLNDCDFLTEQPTEQPTEQTESEFENVVEENTNGVKTDGEESSTLSDPKEKALANRRGNRHHPYKNGGVGDKKGGQRNRVFISNIPYDMKWQAIKDLMREKVGEVTYVELFKDAEGKSRVSDFKDEEFVKKAVDTMNKHDLSGRPLNIKEDPDGEHARRVLQRMGGMMPGSRGPEGGPGGMNLPPSLANSLNIPPDILNAMQAGRLGTTVFVANLDFKVGWKKLKEVFAMAGVVKRADVKEDKDGKSRGMGTVTFEQPLEAVQAICILQPVGGGMGNMAMGSGVNRMGMAGMDMSRGFGGFGGAGRGGAHMGGAMSDRVSGAKGGCVIFVRNLSYDLNWQKLKESFSHCGQVMFADVKMENGRSKGCGTVRFDSPEGAEQACRMMNGTKINGREVDVRIDRNV